MKYKIKGLKEKKKRRRRRVKKNEYFDLCIFWKASVWQISSYL